MDDSGSRVIPLARASTFAGQAVRASGWGYEQYAPGSEGVLPSVLQFLDTRIISRDECVARTGFNIPPSTICTTSALGQGTCMGDGGKIYQPAD